MTTRANGGPVDPNRLRIHFYVSSSHKAGTYFRFHNLAVGLTQLGHRVTVYASDVDRRSLIRTEIRDGVPYVIRPEHWLNRLCWLSSDPITVIRRWASRCPPCDVAHLFQPFPSAAAPWLRASTRVRFYDWDDLWSGGLMSGPVSHWREHWPRLLVRFLEHKLPRWAEHVTVVGSFLADMAWERAARAVTVIHNGSWSAPFPDRLTARVRLRLRADALYAGFMGRTWAELPWCFDAVAAYLGRFPALRLVLCGPPESAVLGLPELVRERVDYLGQLAPESTRDFAAALDIGLLPQDENPFNRSRFPIKFSEHLATGVPLLCSTVGECGLLVPRFSWALPAGTTRAEWVNAFGLALDRVSRGDVPAFDPHLFREHLSWDGLSRTLAKAYRVALTGCPPAYASNRPLSLRGEGI